MLTYNKYDNICVTRRRSSVALYLRRGLEYPTAPPHTQYKTTKLRCNADYARLASVPKLLMSQKRNSTQIESHLQRNTAKRTQAFAQHSSLQDHLISSYCRTSKLDKVQLDLLLGHLFLFRQIYYLKCVLTLNTVVYQEFIFVQITS